jgi:integrase
MLKAFRDDVLPKTPKHAHRAGADAADWPRISPGEISRRVAIVARLFTWLHVEGWIAADISKDLAGKGSAESTAKTAAHEDRSAFTDDELKAIFSAPWFATGRGERTRAGTYREFMPYYFWLPIIGLLTGCRLNEVCQLEVGDFQQTPSGTWFFAGRRSQGAEQGCVQVVLSAADEVRLGTGRQAVVPLVSPHCDHQVHE